MARLRELQQRYGLPAESLDLAAVLRLPDVVVSGGAEPVVEGTAKELVDVVDRAVAALTAMREAEGARLAVYLGERLAIVEGALRRIEVRAPERLVEQRDRLRARCRSWPTVWRSTRAGWSRRSRFSPIGWT